MAGSFQLLCAALALTLVGRSLLAQQEELDDEEAAMYQRPKLSAKGHVFCDQCGQGLQSNKTVPLQDVEVSVKCRDLYGFVTFSAIGWTNEHGAFTIPMDNIPSISGIAGCKAKLVRSMNEHCNSMTNIGGGHAGAPLLLKSKSFELVVLTTGPFAYSSSSRLPTCQGLPYPSHTPSMHNIGTSYYPSPPPPPPVNRATYFYISPPPPSSHLPPHSSPLHPPPPHPPPPPPPPSPPPPPPYWYRSPPPSPFYWYKSPPPPSIVTHSSPPPSPLLHRTPSPSPISYTHRYHYHHHHQRSPLPPPYYYSSPPPPPLHPPPLRPYHYIYPPPTKSLSYPHPPPPSYHYKAPPTPSTPLYQRKTPPPPY